MYGKIVVIMLLTLPSTLLAVPGRLTRFRVLADGWEVGEADARESVIRDSNSLHTIWDELHPRSDQASGSSPAAPNVDFTTHVVVFIRMETQPDTTDSDVKVIRVVRARARERRNAQTVITVEETHREAGCLADRYYPARDAIHVS